MATDPATAIVNTALTTAVSAIPGVGAFLGPAVSGILNGGGGGSDNGAAKEVANQTAKISEGLGILNTKVEERTNQWDMKFDHKMESLTHQFGAQSKSLAGEVKSNTVWVYRADQKSV